jgi:hypothetical protein
LTVHLKKNCREKSKAEAKYARVRYGSSNERKNGDGRSIWCVCEQGAGYELWTKEVKGTHLHGDHCENAFEGADEAAVLEEKA